MDGSTIALGLILLAFFFLIFGPKSPQGNVFARPWILCLAAAAIVVAVTVVRHSIEEYLADRARHIADRIPPLTDQQFTFLELHLGTPLRKVAEWSRGKENGAWITFACGGFGDREREASRGRASRFNELNREAQRRLPLGTEDIDANATRCKFYRFKGIFDGWGEHRVSFADGSVEPTFYFLDKNGTFVLYRIDWMFSNPVKEDSLAITAYSEKYGTPETGQCMVGSPYSSDVKGVSCFTWRRSNEILAVGRPGRSIIVDIPTQAIVAGRERELLEEQAAAREKQRRNQERLKLESNKKNI